MSVGATSGWERKPEERREGLAPRRSRRRRVPVAVAVLLGAGALAAGAEEAAPAADPPPAVGLDRLLQLPKSATAESGRKSVGGVSREQWRTRYSLLRDALADERHKLDAGLQELQELADDTSSWQMSAPGVGGGGSDAPLSFRLRQQIRHSREEIERLERSLKDLRIEAELAGVPPDWLTEEAEAEAAPAFGSSR